MQVSGSRAIRLLVCISALGILPHNRDRLRRSRNPVLPLASAFPSPRRGVLVAIVSVTLAAVLLLLLASQSYFRSIEVSDARNRLSLYARAFDDAVKRFDEMPFVLANDGRVAATLQGQGVDKMNVLLELFADRSGLEAIYVMDHTGLVIATSNHASPRTFLGQNYGFRPYFQTAMAGGRGTFFGVGATTGRPGYFVSEPVSINGIVIGVVAIKIDLSELQKTLEAEDERLLVENRDGVVVLSSNPDWLYGLLRPANNERLAAIEASQQFGGQLAAPLNWNTEDDNAVVFDGERLIHVSGPTGRDGWTLHYLRSDARVNERSALATFLLGLLVTALVAFSFFLRSKRVEAAFKASQIDRDKLRATNQELEQAQGKLAEASKLAALGQLSASVTHELVQPISALRNYVAAAEIGGEFTSGNTPRRFERIIDRMEEVTRQFRFFSRPHDVSHEPVDLCEIVRTAWDFLDHDLHDAEVVSDLNLPREPVRISGHALRLERVVINVVRNAMGAMVDTSQKQLKLSVSTDVDHAILSVRDTGSGLKDAKLDDLVQPFHTTKASGDGVGLGLAIVTSIVAEHGGAVEVEDAVPGARFTIRLPLLEAEEHPVLDRPEHDLETALT